VLSCKNDVKYVTPWHVYMVTRGHFITIILGGEQPDGYKNKGTGLVLGSVKLFHKFERGHPSEGTK